MHAYVEIFERGRLLALSFCFRRIRPVDRVVCENGNVNTLVPRSQPSRVLVVAIVAVVGSFLFGSTTTVASAKTPTTKRRSSKAAPTKKRVTTTRPPTTRPPTTLPPTTLPPTTLPPTTVAKTLPTTIPAPSSTAAPLATIASSASTTISGSGVLPTLPANSSLVSFERSLYTLNMPANTPVNANIYLNIAQGFTDTLVLRTPGGTPGLTVTIDRNPVRNFFVLTVTGAYNAPPLNQFIIEASASGDPNTVLARTTIAVFLTGTTTPSGTIGVTPPGGDPNAAPGIAYGLNPASVTIKRGGDAGSVKIDMVRQGNFVGAVSFERPTVIPVGMGTSFQESVSYQSSDYLYISAGSNAQLGSYTLSFVASTVLQRTTLTVTVIVVA
jgi:hypothetical protein